MNIFYLDKNPIIAAQMQCDKHVVKMTLESAQLLCSVYPNGFAPYKSTHYNHPCAKWARHSKTNYEWLLTHARALADEYTFRYGKVHASKKVIEWCENEYVKLNFPYFSFTEPPQCMPEKYHQHNVVEAYRQYYLNDKAYMAKWAKTRTCPKWWNDGAN